MNPHANHKQTLIMHNQHIFKAVEVAEFFGHKQIDLGIENAVRVLLYVTSGFPECTVTVDNETRVRLLIEHAPGLEEFEMLDKLIESTDLDILQRRLKIRGSAVSYQVHVPEFTLLFTSDGPGFAFPLQIDLIAWTDLSEPGSHSDHCRYHEDESLNGCECEPIEKYRNTLVQDSYLAWRHLLQAFIRNRFGPMKPMKGVGPRAGGRIFD